MKCYPKRRAQDSCHGNMGELGDYAQDVPGLMNTLMTILMVSRTGINSVYACDGNGEHYSDNCYW